MRWLALIVLAGCGVSAASQTVPIQRNLFLTEMPMDKHAIPCRFEAVEPNGLVVFNISGQSTPVSLRGARIVPSKAAEAGAFLSDRAPRVNLRCTLLDPGPPAVAKVELLAWRDKSGDVWQDLGQALVRENLAETVAN